MALALGRPDGAARLLGAAAALGAAAGVRVEAGHPAGYVRTSGGARAALGDGPFQARRAEGQTMTLDQAVAEARAALGPAARSATTRHRRNRASPPLPRATGAPQVAAFPRG